MIKSLKKLTVLVGTLSIGSAAFASGPDFSSLSSVDLGSAALAVIAIGGAIATVRVAVAGTRAVLRMISG
ncbi:hypothetical protein [Rodentibacter pneumotropicus]|uniref:Phage coat protein n=1 Tax=Rodentibacter pneumotropicus TaxID=758 RepID=A0AAW5LB88_9PAST|nr:hypothetical protein [Rodentibacter pneumotropicus]MCQ9120818.1 hypothetical protein [Rodentibacter pneumotropicus]NBH74745.1 hypothetical protein [Rodentibacter pneumotropicus]OOF62887.1 hypothetical protein BH925_09285 [Rodentibacter pneumotropicus]OOF68996.1 hypothetical protein BKG95_01665 [Rodentibacter pneumotropicus]TGZ98184.1 hypothetical protein D3M72_10965 [Rodentibacter pneumotropicus]